MAPGGGGSGADAGAAGASGVERGAGGAGSGWAQGSGSGGRQGVGGGDWGEGGADRAGTVLPLVVAAGTAGVRRLQRSTPPPPPHRGRGSHLLPAQVPRCWRRWHPESWLAPRLKTALLIHKRPLILLFHPKT